MLFAIILVAQVKMPSDSPDDRVGKPVAPVVAQRGLFVAVGL
jgi:hypothetical protein